MTDQSIPLPDFKRAWIDDQGRPTTHMQFVIRGFDRRLGGRTDKLNATKTTADAAAPGTAEVVPGAGLQGGGAIGVNAAVSLYCYEGPVAGLSSLSQRTGDWAYATNGRKAGEGAGSGSGTPVWFDGASWIAPDTGTGVTA